MRLLIPVARISHIIALVPALVLPCLAQQPATPAAGNATAPAAEASEAGQDIAAARAKLAKVEAAGKGDTVELAQALNDLISTQLDDSRASKETLELAERELKVAEAAAGKRSKAYVAALSDASEVRVALGRHAEARPYAEKALEIAQKEFPDAEEGINASDELAYVCLYLNDLQCSKHAEEAAIAIERKPGPDHDWDLAYTLSTYAEVLRRMGDEKGSGAAAEECLAAALRSKPDDPHVGVFENSLGSHYMRAEDFPHAIVHFNAASERLSKTYGPHSAWVMDVAGNLASVYSRSGDFKQAWPKYEFALQNRNSPYDDRADQHADFARSLASGGSLQRAIDEALVASRMGRESFTLQARVLPERQVLAYAQRRAKGLDTALSVVARHPDLPTAAVYDEMVRSRALVADEMARRQRNLNASNDAETARLISELNGARADLLELERHPEKSGGDAAIFAARTRMEKIERELAERVAVVHEDEAVNSAGLEELRHALPPHSVLVSYWAFSRRVVDKVDSHHFDTPAYLAVVVQPESPNARVIDLGDAKPIEDAVNRMRASANAEAHGGGVGSARNERAYREAGADLRKLVWDPLHASVGSAELVILVPDGMLDLVPFASLPDGASYLAERKQVIHTISSERDLLTQYQPVHRSGLLAFGSPQFDVAQNNLAQNTPPPPSAERLRNASIPCDALQQVEFGPLEGAALELREIDSTWHRWNPAEPAALITGDQATRARFLQDAPRYRVLHVATHAFVLDRRCGDDNPLLHSGLVFAGANRDRGASILTAQEIASLDLSGVEWAVLSACNTGTGVLIDGEGVLGLERAFRIAGARNVVMTLWPVDDRITARFMRHLYGERLEQHASTAEAVWDSTRKMLDERRAAGKSTHPWYWAGFVGSGWDPDESASESLARK
ncbi:CHAT domain-containing protein [Occallatibacter riparius]|uniref:CHAT domain-containing protein n=1 Tax=Occallatibacter riparius TaxID=1002689 RepID=A0A9J7BU70_9BACT|nr:CHAT domain-containing tetratricopeptide repeat protein [Occallatibacter riparius]UWZ84478.1 CHAT domain-containing protein [Occallatibacter riparius]